MPHLDDRSANFPIAPLPNPGEGGPVAPLPDGGYIGPNGNPVIPLPNPGEGGPVAPLPNGGSASYPVIPLPNPGEGGPVGPGPVVIWPRVARVRFLNAAFGYGPFRILISNYRVVNALNYAGVSGYGQVSVGYQTVTVTGMDGYIYIQKTMPFHASSITTIAIINTPSGLDLLEISDSCCQPGNNFSNFRVSNLALNSRPLDVLLGDGRVVYTDVRYKETTAYKRIRPGNYQFFFAETSLSPMPGYLDIETLDAAFLGMYPPVETVASLYLPVSPNASYTVFILSSGTATNSVQTLLVTDR